MKFGRYLAENLTPEWKRAYIDYRACKKAIKVIANRLQDVSPEAAAGIASDVEMDDDVSSGDDEDVGPSAPPRRSPAANTVRSASTRTPKVVVPASPAENPAGAVPSPQMSRSNSRRNVPSPSYGATLSTGHPLGSRSLVPPPLELGASSYEDQAAWASATTPNAFGHSSVIPEQDELSCQSSDGSKGSASDPNLEIPDTMTHPLTSPLPQAPRESPRLTTPRFFRTPSILGTPRMTSGPGAGRRSLRSFTMPSPRQPREAPTPTPRKMQNLNSVQELYDSLEQDEKAFFDLLQKELDKVEDFYKDRVAEAEEKAHNLRDQLKELAEHRKIFHEHFPKGLPDWEAKVGRMLPGTTSASRFGTVARQLRLRIRFTEEELKTERKKEEAPDNGVTQISQVAQRARHIPDTNGANNASEETNQRLREEMDRDAVNHNYSPERYNKYKRDLRDACMEFYRHLELIKNYRIMNLTGFRKALKKFEKTTRIPCLELYTDEKITKSTFTRGRTVDVLIMQMEQLYTEQFEHGDAKRARDKLRRQQKERTHYFSVLSTGLFLGFGFPPAVLALVKTGQEETRVLIPGWQGVLQIYGGFYLAVLFALLFQLNLDAYVQARINYEFVMELSKPTMDYRTFAQIPAFLFMTLGYCMFFTFYRVAPENVDPTTWPLAWLVFTIVFFINPLNICRKSARFWFLRVLFRTFTPGFSKVDFISFFMADELTSLVYTMQNFYFIGCTYSHHFPRNIYGVCPSGRQWPYAVLLCLPAFLRMVQCMKRWFDCGLGIHLINAGKYATTIAQLSLFVYWRHFGRRLHGAPFISFVIVSTIYSTYTAIWDVVVDWSLFRRDSGLLRRDRAYPSKWIYHFAVVANTILRFYWVFYLPNPQSYANVRTFYLSGSEMIRRWIWNFFRVETEHLGNADAYRVTREIPLPYRRAEHDSDDDDQNAVPRRARTNPFIVQMDKVRRGLVGRDEGGRVPGSENAGPMGHFRQREYEARRPGDDQEPAETGV